MRRKILLFIGIIAIFFVVFIVSIFFMLPTRSIAHYLEKTIEKQLNYKQSVEINSLFVSPLLNATIEDVTFSPREIDDSAAGFATQGGEFNGFYCAPYVSEQAFTIHEISVNPSVFNLIRKKISGDFNVELESGSLSGSIQSKQNASNIIADAKDISLNEFALLSNLSKMQLYGMLDFSVNAILEKNSLVSLNLKLSSKNTALCPKRLKLSVPSMPYIDLPFTVFGNINASVEMAKDKVNIHKLTSDGPDIRLDIKGSIDLKTRKNPVPRLALEVLVTPSDEWMTTNDMNALYQLCEKLDDGSIRIDVRGTTKKPKIDCGTPVAEPLPELPETQPESEKTETDDNQKTLDKTNNNENSGEKKK